MLFNCSKPQGLNNQIRVWPIFFVLAGAVHGLIPLPVHADVGLPMLVIAWPVAWIALMPIIAIEAFLAIKILAVSWKQAFKISSLANLLSTLIGIPVTWGLLFALEFGAIFSVGYVSDLLKYNPDDSLMAAVFFPFYAAWLPPTENKWVVYAAFLVLLIPFYFMSVAIEVRLAKRFLKTETIVSIRRWGRIANAATYLMMAIGAGIFCWLHK